MALLRLKAPYEPRPGGFEAHFHAGSLEFPVEEVQRLQALFSTVPTVVDLYLDRPAIVTWTDRPSCPRSQLVRPHSS